MALRNGWRLYPCRQIYALSRDRTDVTDRKGHSLTMQQLDDTQRILKAGLAEMKGMLTAAADSSIPSRQLSIDTKPPPESSSTTVARPPTQNPVHVQPLRIHQGSPWASSKGWESRGLHGSVIKSTRGKSTDYNVTFKVNLPLAWLFGSYALTGELSIRTDSIRQNTLTLRHPSYLTVARVFPGTHPFLQALRKNDEATVRAMLRTGEGRPTDVDSDGQNCLYVSLINSFNFYLL